MNIKRATAVAVVCAVIVLLAQARLHRGSDSGAASAIGSLTAVGRAQAAYAAGAGRGGYAAQLRTLATPCPTDTDRLLTPDLASDPATKTGYEIRLQAKPTARQVSSDCNGAPTFSGYYLTATPVAGAGPAFATDEAGTVWTDANGVAPTLPFREQGTVKAVR